MREAALSQLRDLNDRLAILNEQSDAWLDEFARLWRMDVVFLRRYNDVVLTWITAWKERFQHRLSTESIFTAEDSDSDIHNILARARSELKTFLNLRNHLFQMGLRDVTCVAHLPANMAYVFAVQSVLPENESACVWLMPWVKCVISSATPTDFKLATEDPITGRFKTPEFVMDSDGESLIAVKDYLYYVSCNENHAVEFFQNERRQRIIRNAFGLPALNYMRALQYFYNEQHTNTTVFAYHVVRFAAALNEYSVNRGATELRAKAGYEDRVIEFYSVWSALPEALQKQLGAAKIVAAECKFEEYLYTLFITVPEIDLPETLKAEIEERGIIKCSAVMSSILFAFAREHAEWREVEVVSSNAVSRPLYTEEDMTAIKEAFENSFSSSSHIFSCPDVFALAIYPCELLRCDQFFKVASIISLLPQAYLSQFMEGNPVTFCDSAEKVLHFLSYIDDYATRAHCFGAFSSYWQKYFNTQNRFILLFSFFDLHHLECVVNVFSGAIKSYLFFNGENDSASWMDQQCTDFSFQLQTVFQHFVMGVLTHAPVLIENAVGLSKCLRVFDTENAYRHIFDLVPHYVGQLSSDPVKILHLITLLEKIPATFFVAFSVNHALSVLFPRVLPHIFSDQQVETLWDSGKSTGCCSGLFGGSKVDNKAHADLVAIMMQECEGDLTQYEACSHRVMLLAQFISDNLGSGFLSAVNAHYPKGFVATVKEKMLEIPCSVSDCIGAAH